MMTMLRTKYGIAGAVLVVLLVANIIIHIWMNWGLVTVKVTDAPIGQVIKSIERQGWVTIYSNIDPQTKVSMYVDHVPVPEALETLALNADAQWRLAFFVAPDSSQVKEEIRSFTEGAERNDNTSIYSFMTPLNFIAGDTSSVADPARKVWPGMRPRRRPRPTARAPAGVADAAPPGRSAEERAGLPAGLC